MRVGDWPRGGVAGGVEGEGVGERPGGGVAGSERVPQTPLLAQRGDQGRVPVLLVEYLAFGYPRGDHDRRDPVARAVEGEPELARRGGRVWRWHRGGRDVVVGAARFVPADEQGGVPDVGPGWGLHGLVSVVDPAQ